MAKTAPAPIWWSRTSANDKVLPSGRKSNPVIEERRRTRMKEWAEEVEAAKARSQTEREYRQFIARHRCALSGFPLHTHPDPSFGCMVARGL